jgi:hypothetical protein
MVPIEVNELSIGHYTVTLVAGASANPVHGRPLLIDGCPRRGLTCLLGPQPQPSVLLEDHGDLLLFDQTRADLLPNAPYLVTVLKGSSVLMVQCPVAAWAGLGDARNVASKQLTSPMRTKVPPTPISFPFSLSLSMFSRTIERSLRLL